MWVRAYDDEVQTQGASIDNLELLYSNLGVVGGSISSTITSVVGAQINAIQEDLESWIDVETGMMYSGWQVRINQYNNGVPTIAGIGLGMQNDPSNPNGGSISNFIVMADYFSIIRPPDAEDLEGDLLPGDIFVPFIVNTGNVPGEPDVIINGDMFVRNTLSAHNGVAGRFVFTNLDEYGYPETRDVNFDATGNRLVLASDTNHYNESNSASPFVGGSNPQKFHMWAGTGTMNHNNATFYVDTDGNGFFNGQVLADNVSGDISNIHSVDVSAAVQTASGSGWTDVATSGEFAPVGNRERTPSIVVNVDMFGTGQTAGRARIEGRAKVNGVWGSWQLIAESPIYMPIGTTLTLAGVMSPTTGIVQLKSSISRQESSPGNWEYPSSSYMKGVLQMLA
jgi:predicted phage tail protein